MQAMGRRWRSGVCFLCFWDACHLCCGRRKCFAGASVGFLANAAVLCAAVYEAEQQACGLSGLRAAAARGFCEIWCLCVCLCVIFFFFFLFFLFFLHPRAPIESRAFTRVKKTFSTPTTPAAGWLII